MVQKIKEAPEEAEEVSKKGAVPKKEKNKDLYKEWKKTEAQKIKDEDALKKIGEEQKKKKFEDLTKKVDAYAPITTESNDLKSLMKKCATALEKNAEAEDVVKIMLAVQEQLTKNAKGEEAEALGKILMKLAGRRPDAWELLKAQAIAEGKKGGWATTAVSTVSDTLKKLKKTEKYLSDYGKLGASKLNEDEMMRIVGIIENKEGKAPLAATIKLLKLEELKKPMTLLEETSLLIELHKRKSSKISGEYLVSADYLKDRAFALEDEIAAKMDSDLLKYAFLDVVKGTKTLDDALFESIRHENMQANMPDWMKVLLEESNDLNTFMGKLGEIGGEGEVAAKKTLENLKSMRNEFKTMFEARTMLLEMAEMQIDKQIEVEAGKRAKNARYLFQNVKWSKIKEYAYWKWQAIAVEKIGVPWAEFGSAWLGEAGKTESKWRIRKSATWNVGKQLLVAGAIAGGIYAIYWGYTKYAGYKEKQAAADFKKDFKKNFGIEYPISDESISFYFGTDDGKRALNALAAHYPTPKAVQFLLGKQPANAEALKTQVLDASGLIIKPEKFKVLLDDLMKAAKTSKVEPEKLVADKIAEWNKKGYMVTAGQNYISQFCNALDIENKYATKFMEQEKDFVSMWSLIMGGTLPRSMANDYAAVLLADAKTMSWADKKKKLDAMVLSVPMVESSLMDVLDQYAVKYGKEFTEYEDIAALYKKDTTAQANLNAYKIKSKEAIYGDVFGLVMLAYGVAKGEMTEENDPHKGIVSGESKFKNEKGEIKEFHYWVWIGEESLMDIYPKMTADEDTMSFILKYSNPSKLGEKESKEAGMLGWLIDNGGKVADGFGATEHFALSESNLETYKSKKGGYAYPGVYNFLNTQVFALEKKGIYKKGIKTAPSSLLPTEIIPRGGLIPAEKGAKKEEVEIPAELKEKSKDLLAFVDVRIESLANNKFYKKAVGKGYSDEEIVAAVHDSLLKLIAEAKEKGENALADLKNKYGIALDETTKEPIVDNMGPLDSSIINMIAKLPGKSK
ncbi:hypothetical protein H0O02_01325 [Candidatus Micrarchaeota archaeon]|nr:hypothetical protein [Candidatus Micrarchaeota archaeon]